jgi:precorrin-3B methylase
MSAKIHRDRDIIYQAILNKLELAVIEELPLLIYNIEEEDHKRYRSILDILIDNKAFSLTQVIINLALTQDKTGLMYDELTRYIDKLNFSMSDVKVYL